MYTTEHLPKSEFDEQPSDSPPPALMVGFLPRPCNCKECLQQFALEHEQIGGVWTCLQYTVDSEAQQIAADYVKSTIADREYLTKQCNSHGNTILSRWKR